LDYNIENILSYSKSTDAHTFGITAVQSVLSNRFESISARGTNQLIPNQLFYGLANANQEVTIASNYRASGLLSYTGRVQYSYKDKYLFMATGRADGASQLSDGNKWAFFPSASFAWRMIEEDFMKDSRLFTDLKLRASYGVAGNSAVSPYATQSNLIRVPNAWDERPAIGYTFGNRVGNANLGWELSQTNNIGVDFGLWNNRLTGSIDAYSTDTKDLLLQRLLPLTSGFNNIIENVGETNTKGVEIGLGAVAINKGDFRWNVSANWFTARERIVSLATASNDVANGWFIGFPTQAFYDYEKIGIWQTSEADEAAKFNQKPGDIKVKDQNNDGVIDSNNDRVVLGTERPTWSGNLNNDIKYKNFDLNIQIFARWGQMMRYGITGNYDPQANGNSLSHDYWTPENPTNEFPRPSANRSQAATLYYSSMFFKDASFVKLRGVTLGYTLPASALSKVGISGLRIYASGRNLLTFSKIKNYDPERGGALTNPMTRLIVTGINLEF
jgi:TonB-linked SusC/RagA family outer membrane protein